MMIKAVYIAVLHYAILIRVYMYTYIYIYIYIYVYVYIYKIIPSNAPLKVLEMKQMTC